MRFRFRGPALAYVVAVMLAWATPAIAAVVYTTIANVFTANQRINAGLGINVAPGATGTISLSGGIFERSRSTALGEWTAVAFNAANFTASTGTWTVESGDVNTYAYMQVGKTLFVELFIQQTTVSATPTFLDIALPAGFTVAKTKRQIFSMLDLGVGQIGFCQANVTETRIRCVALYTGAPWSTQTNQAYILGGIAFEVQ